MSISSQEDLDLNSASSRLLIIYLGFKTLLVSFKGELETVIIYPQSVDSSSVHKKGIIIITHKRITFQAT